MPRHSRHRGAGQRDARHAGLGTASATGPINITPPPAVMTLLAIDPIAVLSPINITPPPAVMTLLAIGPTVDLTVGKTVYVWVRVNGVDIDNSNVIQLIEGNESLSVEQILELKSGDYVELMFAVGDLSVNIEAVPVSAFGPATPSVSLNVREICQ